MEYGPQWIQYGMWGSWIPPWLVTLLLSVPCVFTRLLLDCGPCLSFSYIFMLVHILHLPYNAWSLFCIILLWHMLLCFNILHCILVWTLLIKKSIFLSQFHILQNNIVHPDLPDPGIEWEVELEGSNAIYQYCILICHSGYEKNWVTTLSGTVMVVLPLVVAIFVTHVENKVGTNISYFRG